MNDVSPHQAGIAALVTRPAWTPDSAAEDQCLPSVMSALAMMEISPDPRMLGSFFQMPGTNLLMVQLARDLVMVAGSHAGSQGAEAAYRHPMRPNIAATAIVHSHAPQLAELTLHGDVIFVGGSDDQDHLEPIDKVLASGLISWLETSEAEDLAAAAIGAHRTCQQSQPSADPRQLNTD